MGSAGEAGCRNMRGDIRAMKVLKKVTRLVDIGRLDATMTLPTEPRTRFGLKTVCDRCGKPITDEYFIAGFKSGEKNMLFHEACVEKMEPVTE